MNEIDKTKFAALAQKAKEYIESIHEEAKEKYYSSGENYMDEWLEFTIQETEELLHELQIVIDKYNGVGVACEEVKSYNYLRMVK